MDLTGALEAVLQTIVAGMMAGTLYGLMACGVGVRDARREIRAGGVPHAGHARLAVRRRADRVDRPRPADTRSLCRDFPHHPRHRRLRRSGPSAVAIARDR